LIPKDIQVNPTKSNQPKIESGIHWRLNGKAVLKHTHCYE